MLIRALTQCSRENQQMPPPIAAPTLDKRTWWHRGKPYSPAELFWDAVVHAVGLVVAAVAAFGRSYVHTSADV